MQDGNCILSCLNKKGAHPKLEMGLEPDNQEMGEAAKDSIQATTEVSARQDPALPLQPPAGRGKGKMVIAREDPIEMCDAFKHRCILSLIIRGSRHCLWVSLTWDWGD